MTTETIEKEALELYPENWQKPYKDANYRIDFGKEEREAYIAGVTKVLAEKDKEIEGLREENTLLTGGVCDLDDAIQKKNLDLAAKDLELQNLKAVGEKLADVTNDYLNNDLPMVESFKQALSDWQRLKEKV